MRQFFFWFVLFLIAAFWGGAFAAIKFILRFISPTELLVYRFMPTAIICILAALVFYRRDSLALFKKYWVVLITISILWLFGYHLTLNIGETVLPAGPAGLIIGTYPIFTIFLAPFFIREKLTPGKLIGGIIGFIGTAFLMIQGAQHEGAVLNIEPSKWILYGLITLIAPVSAAVHTIIAKPYLTGENRDGVRMDPIQMNILYMAPAVVFLVPFILTGPSRSLMEFPASFWIALGFLVIFCTLGAYIGWLWAVAKLGAGRVAVTAYVIPLFSLAFARIWLGEPIGMPTIVGAVCIIVGVIFANAGGKLNGD